MRAGPRPPRPIGDAFHERLNFGPEDTLGWSAGRSGRAWIFDWRSDRSLSPHHVGIPAIGDGRLIMTLYSSGLVLIFGTFLLLYLRAWLVRRELGLNPLMTEAFRDRGSSS